MAEEGSCEIINGIKESLLSERGFLVGRFGTIEFEACWESTRGILKKHTQLLLERNAGVFPSSIGSIQKWVSNTKEAFQAADILATGWCKPIVEVEKVLLEDWGVSAKHIVLRGLEPYYSSEKNRWSRLLNGQKVCVVSSFTDTIFNQLSKGEGAIWPGANDSIWPSSTEWSFVKTGYAPSMALGRASWEEDPASWEEAVAYVVESVMKTGARIVLIGCGGLGMLIGNELKQRGKICIIIGGAIQVLFGIKGERWRTHDIISKLWNDTWVYPSIEETPGYARAVENSCYWSASPSSPTGASPSPS
jgi:hypothetical protein